MTYDFEPRSLRPFVAKSVPPHISTARQRRPLLRIEATPTHLAHLPRMVSVSLPCCTAVPYLERGCTTGNVSTFGSTGGGSMNPRDATGRSDASRVSDWPGTIYWVLFESTHGPKSSSAQPHVTGYGPAPTLPESCWLAPADFAWTARCLRGDMRYEMR